MSTESPLKSVKVNVGNFESESSGNDFDLDGFGLSEAAIKTALGIIKK